MDNHSHLLIRRFSQALGRHIRLIALVPEGPGGPWPAALLLHGMCDDESTWLRRTALERYVLGRGLAVIIRALLALPENQRKPYRDLLDEHLRRGLWAKDILPQFELQYDWRAYAARVQQAAAELACQPTQARWETPPATGETR